MALIEKQYPEGQHSAEMVLISMLQEHRSWHDYLAITNALWRIRYHAKSMQENHRKLSNIQTESKE